jgi:hypothetical protein
LNVVVLSRQGRKLLSRQLSPLPGALSL